jgi:cob(I)alamin adenosyltransferase
LDILREFQFPVVEIFTMSDTSQRQMMAIDAQTSHLWMVRAFLKHSDEAADDEELAEIHRDLYDFMLALGNSRDAGQPDEYLHLARKKYSKLRRATELFLEIQPEVSGHTNFRMAARSLKQAVSEIGRILDEVTG